MRPLYALLFSGQQSNYDLALQLAESQGIDLQPTIEALKHCEAYYRSIKRWGAKAFSPFEFVVYLLERGFRVFRTNPQEVTQHLSVLAPFLRYLDLSQSVFETLPEILRDFEQLERLSFAGNQINEIPDWLWALPRISSVNISANQYRSISPQLQHASALRWLRLGSRYAIQLPSQLADLPHLEGLEYWTPFDAQQPIPAVLFDCWRVKHLGVGGNIPIDTFNKITQFIYLEEIILVNTDWATLPAVLTQLPRLQRISLGRMPNVSAFPTVLYQIPSLQTMEYWLSPDFILQQGADIQQLQHLKDFYIYRDTSTQYLFTDPYKQSLEAFFDQYLPQVKLYIM